jgi:hypothetical protein
MKKMFYTAVVLLLVMVSCAKEDFGITEIDNPRADKKVTMYDETVTVKFMADGPWYA